jgi:ubiquinone/menaquinone biosynthesis C-methylase UbiE
MNRTISSDRPSASARLLAWLDGFYRRPAKPLYHETARYHQWLRGNADLLYAQVYSRYTTFRDKAILDLACGHGGKLAAYSKHEARHLCGLDINPAVLREAAASLPEPLPSPVSFVAGDAHALPFKDSAFDVVISDDGFDHFRCAAGVLREIARVLKPGGLALISFVPYGSPNCSHLNEYLQFPWHHIFWSRKALWQALCLVAERESKGADASSESYRTPIAGVFHTFQHHLSRLTIRGFCEALGRTQDVELVRLRKQSSDWARPMTYVPLLRELFTDAVYCVLRKNPGARIRQHDFARQRSLDVVQDARALWRRVCHFATRLPSSAKGP